LYRKLLVPLDGSTLAECALPHVKNLMSAGCAEEATILNVLREHFIPFEYGPSDLEIMEKYREERRKYLADVEQRLDAEGIKVQTELLENDHPANAISDYAAHNGIDMIILATHGYTGLKKMMLGSVALEVLHDSHVPVLLIRPESCRT